MIPHRMDDIFAFAKDLERHSYRFYSFLAGHVTSPEAQEAFQQFAEDEQKHLLLLGQIQADFCHAIARGCVGSHDNSVTVQWMTEDGSTPLVPDPLAELTGFESTEELVEMGIELEASSAALYSALQGMVAIETCRQQVEQMAKQERAHLVTLQQLAIAVSQSA